MEFKIYGRKVVCRRKKRKKKKEKTNGTHGSKINTVMICDLSAVFRYGSGRREVIDFTTNRGEFAISVNKSAIVNSPPLPPLTDYCPEPFVDRIRKRVARSCRYITKTRYRIIIIIETQTFFFFYPSYGQLSITRTSNRGYCSRFRGYTTNITKCSTRHPPTGLDDPTRPRQFKNTATHSRTRFDWRPPGEYARARGRRPRQSFPTLMGIVVGISQSVLLKNKLN